MRCEMRPPESGRDGPAPVPGKTLITHLDEGLDFLGWHIQRHRERGTRQHYVYGPQGGQGGHGQGKGDLPPGSQPGWKPCCTRSTGCCGTGSTTSGPACR
jgi:hypothetical protein